MYKSRWDNVYGYLMAGVIGMVLGYIWCAAATGRTDVPRTERHYSQWE